MQLNPHWAAGSCIAGVYEKSCTVSPLFPLSSWCSEQSSTGDEDLGLKSSTFKQPDENWDLNFIYIRCPLAHLLTFLSHAFPNILLWLPSSTVSVKDRHVGVGHSFIPGAFQVPKLGKRDLRANKILWYDRLASTVKKQVGRGRKALRGTQAVCDPLYLRGLISWILQNAACSWQEEVTVGREEARKAVSSAVGKQWKISGVLRLRPLEWRHWEPVKKREARLGPAEGNWTTGLMCQMGQMIFAYVARKQEELVASEAHGLATTVDSPQHT